MNVMPTSCWIVFSSSCICLRSLRSSAPSGSSSSNTFGRFTSARASATRCCWPPDISRGLRVSNPLRSTSCIASLTRLVDLVLGDLLPPEAEGDVLRHIEVGEQRVGLEDRVHVALVRREVGHVASAQVDGPERRLLEAADHPQRGRLPAARRPQHAEELALLDVEREVVNGGRVPEELRDALEAYVDLGHSHPLRGPPADGRRHKEAAGIITRSARPWVATDRTLVVPLGCTKRPGPAASRNRRGFLAPGRLAPLGPIPVPVARRARGTP